MSDLRAFMAGNVEADEVVEYAVSKRFVDKEGNPIKWQLKPINSKEDERIRKECTRKVPVPGKRNQRMPETDLNEYLGKMTAACIIFPNLNDKELQDSYSVMGAGDLLKTMLKPGEYTELTSKIQEINGFDISMEEKVEEAKN
jgi:hypothetical protein